MKRALVSLAGPLPGIAAGFALVAAALKYDQPWLAQLALFSFIINGLNLLPVVPLDGGKLLGAILFKRHPDLEIGASVGAVACLAVAGIVQNSLVLLGLGVLVAVAIPAQRRLSRIAHELRASDVSMMGDDSESVPPAAARSIVRSLLASPGPPRHVVTVAREVSRSETFATSSLVQVSL